MGRRRSGAGIGALVALGVLASVGSGCAVDGERARHSVIHVYSLDEDGKIIRARLARGDRTHDGGGASEAPIASGPCADMSWPVDGTLSSPFGRRDGKMHDGIDLAVAEETPVRAACDGVVAYAGNGLRGYGNLVILRHEGALATVYAHNHELLVKEGQSVTRGQTIARSGQTGRASAPHLHFEVRKDSIARNPLGYLHRTMSDGNHQLSARRAPVRR